MKGLQLFESKLLIQFELTWFMNEVSQDVEETGTFQAHYVSNNNDV
jgi:hypothetical protein